jgi:hypothetical protein
MEKPTGRYTAKPGLITTDLGSELILLDPGTQQMFSLNAVGRLVWQSLGEHDLAAIAGRIAETFETDTATALRDAEALVAELHSAGLLQRADGR